MYRKRSHQAKHVDRPRHSDVRPSRTDSDDDYETFAYEFKNSDIYDSPRASGDKGQSPARHHQYPSESHSRQERQSYPSESHSRQDQYSSGSHSRQGLHQYPSDDLDKRHHRSHRDNQEKRRHHRNPSEQNSQERWQNHSPSDDRAERPMNHRRKSSDAPGRRHQNRNHSPPESKERKHSQTYRSGQRRDKRHSDGRHSLSRDYQTDIAVLNLAATKVQSAWRGYMARRTYWRERERNRGRIQKQEQHQYGAHYHQDEMVLPSVTSIVGGGSVSSLSANADPNLGLVPDLSPVDSLQRNLVMRDLKAKLNFSEDMPTATQLQTESSPTVVVLGGINPHESTDYFLGGSMFVYNVQKDRWLFGGTLPEPRNYHGAVYLNGKIYVIGGYSPLQVHQGQMLSTQSCFQMTVRSKRWRRRSDMHQARACHGTCVAEENILVMGGRDSSGKLLSTVEIYYPKKDQWSLLKQMPEPIMGMGCAVMDSSVWVIGGIINEGSRFAVSNRVYIFDMQQQNWYHKASLPEPRAYCCAASLKREIWMWCGVKDSLGDDGYLLSANTVFVLNPEVGKWEQHSAIGTAKHSPAVAKFGRRVYLLGGMSNVSSSKEVLAENDFYNRENDRYSEGAPLPRPITGAAAVALPIDYIASSDPKWNLENVNDEMMEEAATKIQAVFRGYRTRSLISNNKFPIHSTSGDIMHRKSFYTTYAESQHNKWKLFQRVQIDDWPPLPDPQSMSSELNVRLGTLPKGYTVTATGQGGVTKVRRYIPLPEHVDPNLGICGHICNIFKRTKKILGLRKVEHMPPFARQMPTATTLQDDSIPVVLVMGGLYPRDPVNLAYGKLIIRYYPLKDRWEYFGLLPEPRNHHAAVYHKEAIYLTGGCDPDKRNCGEMVATATTYCLNIHSSDWQQKADMNCSRSHHALVAHRGKLYAIGGRDHNGRIVASVEQYDIENDKWTLRHAMHHPRMGMSCAVYQDQIWCLGGVGVSDDEQSLSYPVKATCVSYDPEKDAWIPRPPLRCPRAFSTAVVVQDSMWLFGGASKDKKNNCLISMASVDKYYPEEAQWMRRSLLNTPRHCAAVVAVESCVYVIGGVSSQEWDSLSKTEMVILNDVSLHSCAPLPLNLTGASAVCVPPLSPSLRPESVALLLHAQLTFH